MVKAAHIVDKADAEVGDKVLGICGIKFTMQFKWADIPDEVPYCRNCVDTAIACMTDGANAIRDVAYLMTRINALTGVAVEMLDGDNALKEVMDLNDEFYEKQTAKRLAKAAKKAAKAAEKEPDVESRPAVAPEEPE